MAEVRRYKIHWCAVYKRSWGNAMRGKCFAVIAVAVSLAGRGGAGLAQSGAQAQPHKLSAAELRALNSVPHTSYVAGRFGPNTSVAYFTPDGQIKFRSPDLHDAGTYRITDDDKLCTKYRTIRSGLENCQDIYQIGPDTYESHLPNGTIVKSRSVPGNPEGL
jgi:hypothetical protein